MIATIDFLYFTFAFGTSLNRVFLHINLEILINNLKKNKGNDLKINRNSNFLATFSFVPFVIASKAKLNPTLTSQVEIIR